MTRHSGAFPDYLALVERLRPARLVTLRHDLCSCAPDHALAFARLEAAHGLRATYYILHTDTAYQSRLGEIIRELDSLGHDVGIHHASIAAYLKTAVPPADRLRRDLDAMRKHASVVKSASHGSPSTYAPDGSLRVVEYQVFTEWNPAFNVGGSMPLHFERVSAEGLGIAESYFSDDTLYVSDSAGAYRHWHEDGGVRPFERVGGSMVEGLPETVEASDVVTLLCHPAWFNVKEFS